MNPGIHICFLFMDRYHQLIANYGRKKNFEQMSDSEDTTLGTVFDTEELKEGKKIQIKQIVLMVCFLGRDSVFSNNI